MAESMHTERCRGRTEEKSPGTLHTCPSITSMAAATSSAQIQPVHKPKRTMLVHVPKARSRPGPTCQACAMPQRWASAACQTATGTPALHRLDMTRVCLAAYVVSKLHVLSNAAT
jgi:hypothetical protein